MPEIVYYFVDAVEAAKPWYLSQSFWTAVGSVATLLASIFAWRSTRHSAAQAKIMKNEYEERRRPQFRFVGYQWDTPKDSPYFTVRLDFENISVPMKLLVEEHTVDGIHIMNPQSANYYAPGQIFSFVTAIDSERRDPVTICLKFLYGAVAEEGYAYSMEFAIPFFNPHEKRGAGEISMNVKKI